MNFRKVMLDGSPFPTLEIPPKLVGHVRNWLTWAYKGGPTPPKQNGKKFCLEMGLIDPDMVTPTKAGKQACIALGITRVPFYYLDESGVRHDTLPVQYKPRRNRIAELEARIAELEARQS